jgi:hypothetical protein
MKRAKKFLMMLTLPICVLAVSLMPLTAFAATYGPYYVNIYPGQYYVQTYPVYFGSGTMHIYVQNKGPGTLNYYVFYDCGYSECPVLTSGTVAPGSYVAYPKSHPAGNFIFKLEAPYGDTEGHGNISQ